MPGGPKSRIPLTCLQPSCSMISGGNTRDAKARLNNASHFHPGAQYYIFLFIVLQLIYLYLNIFAIFCFFKDVPFKVDPGDGSESVSVLNYVTSKL